jgi:plasmid stabilization system protein ParE
VTPRVVFRPEALEEIEAAAEWYSRRGTGLDAEFLRALDVAVASARREPFLHAVVHPAMRRVLLRRFPYS